MALHDYYPEGRNIVVARSTFRSPGGVWLISSVESNSDPGTSRPCITQSSQASKDYSLISKWQELQLKSVVKSIHMCYYIASLDWNSRITSFIVPKTSLTLCLAAFEYLDHTPSIPRLESLVIKAIRKDVIISHTTVYNMCFSLEAP